MGRYFGKVGYAISVEKMTDDNPPLHTGVFVDSITEREYYGDVTKLSSRWDSSDKLNDDLRCTNQISIIADAFAYQNFSRIKYIEWLGVKWKVTSISAQRPRLMLTLGGEYNGEET